ncbi:MAG: hypothetical protein V1774_10230 [Candidatus Eisenbacteria bacterium]
MLLCLFFLACVDGSLSRAQAQSPLGRMFHQAATGERLVRRGGSGLLAGLADSAHVNEDATIWTFSLKEGPGIPGSAEIAARLNRARRSPMGMLLFRHVHGTAAAISPPASARALPAGILPLGPRRIRFLLDRADPDFPARLAEIEASLCADTLQSADAGCGPFRVSVLLGAQRLEIGRPDAKIGEVLSWTMPQETAAGISQGETERMPQRPLFAATGRMRMPDTDAPIRLGFVLPPLPQYCSAQAPPPAAGSEFVAHVFLVVSEGARAHSRQLHADLAAGDLLPDARAWARSEHLLPGVRIEGDVESVATAVPAVQAGTRQTLTLSYSGDAAALGCIAERIRAVLWPAGWDIRLVREEGVAPQAGVADAPADGMLGLPAPGGPADLSLRMSLTRRRAEAWDHLRNLLDLEEGDALTELSAETLGPGGTDPDPVAEEWNTAAAIEGRLVREGRLVPLLTAPVRWWIEAPFRPEELLDGILPVWEEPPRPLVVITGGDGGADQGESLQ